MERTNIKFDWDKYVDEDEEDDEGFDMSALNGAAKFGGDDSFLDDDDEPDSDDDGATLPRRRVLSTLFADGPNTLRGARRPPGFGRPARQFDRSRGRELYGGDYYMKQAYAGGLGD